MHTTSDLSSTVYSSRLDRLVSIMCVCREQRNRTAHTLNRGSTYFLVIVKLVKCSYNKKLTCLETPSLTNTIYPQIMWRMFSVLKVGQQCIVNRLHIGSAYFSKTNGENHAFLGKQNIFFLPRCRFLLQYRHSNSGGKKSCLL